MNENTTILCSIHASLFKTTRGEVNHNGTHESVKVYLRAGCGCEIEVTTTVSSLELMSA